MESFLENCTFLYNSVQNCTRFCTILEDFREKINVFLVVRPFKLLRSTPNSQDLKYSWVKQLAKVSAQTQISNYIFHWFFYQIHPKIPKMYRSVQKYRNVQKCTKLYKNHEKSWFSMKKHFLRLLFGFRFSKLTQQVNTSNLESL